MAASDFLVKQQMFPITTYPNTYEGNTYINEITKGRYQTIQSSNNDLRKDERKNATVVAHSLLMTLTHFSPVSHLNTP